VAKQVLRDYQPDNDLFPAYHLPKLREAAAEKYADELATIKAAWKRRQDQAVEA
jgi:acyl-CoA dehydrogenase